MSRENSDIVLEDTIGGDFFSLVYHKDWKEYFLNVRYSERPTEDYRCNRLREIGRLLFHYSTRKHLVVDGRASKFLIEAERILNLRHLLGCEFYSGNTSVDGFVKNTRRMCLDSFSVIGDQGYSRNPNDVDWYLEEGRDTLVSYHTYMSTFYPEYKIVWELH